MPYIKHKRKAQLAINDTPKNVGELNYSICVLIQNYIDEHGPANYELLNSIHGVLDCVDKEIYRRLTAPYEDEKIKENGDIF